MSPFIRILTCMLLETTEMARCCLYFPAVAGGIGSPYHLQVQTGEGQFHLERKK